MGNDAEQSCDRTSPLGTASDVPKETIIWAGGGSYYSSESKMSISSDGWVEGG